MTKLTGLRAPPPHLYLSFKIMYLDFNGDFGPPFGPTVGWGSNFSQGTTTVVGGKNFRASVASYPALTFFQKKALIRNYVSFFNYGEIQGIIKKTTLKIMFGNFLLNHEQKPKIKWLI